jgi:hypothetical protein
VSGSALVRGQRGNFVTKAYVATSGALEWTSTYYGPGNSNDVARTVLTSPDGTTVFVAGYGEGVGTSSDLATIAYAA